MGKITVREFDEVIARLTINELLLFKAIMKDWEFYTDSCAIISEYVLTPVYLLTSIERLYKQADSKITDHEIRSSLKSLHKKGIISKCEYRNEMENNDTFHIRINWDSEIEEAVLPDGYTGRIY